MKISEIMIGSTYAVKVRGKVRPVKITSEITTGAFGTYHSVYARVRRMRKFYGISQVSGRMIGPISPARIRFELTQIDGGVWTRAVRKETA